jgi:hypothetical protein
MMSTTNDQDVVILLKEVCDNQRMQIAIAKESLELLKGQVGRNRNAVRLYGLMMVLLGGILVALIVGAIR